MLKPKTIKTLKIAVITVSTMIIIVGIFGYLKYKEVFKPNIKNDVTLYIPSNADYQTLIDSLKSSNALIDLKSFKNTAELKNLQHKVHSGKYLLKKGMQNNKIVNIFRSGNQIPVKLTFNNNRTINDFAGKVSKLIEPDSVTIVNLLNDENAIKQYGFNKENIISMFIPNTYEVWWDISAENFLKRMKKEYDKFWTSERIERAKKLNLTQKEVSILASIVQAEQLAHPDERAKVAGLYINRLKRGMLLQSDPTLIFASGDFTKKRVLNKDKEIDSPYNTYIHAGLPPGPVYMPDISSIDAVLNYQHHNYIFMCAKEDFSGYHNFSTNARQHGIYARKYQQALNKKKIWK
ncbi:MAG: endolytic transglycosylase MltG [Bacteroidetes bacterium]|nr:MAG: endolytic transglycosylase MltG [Bacteroidota bacterium]